MIYWVSIVTSTYQVSRTYKTNVLVIYIPIRLIWKIQIRLSQKIALAFSLCLTIVVITVTAIRASGMLSDDMIDPVWGIYWQFVSAVVGLVLTAVTAFRTFFVSRRKMNKAQPPLQREMWYTKGRKYIKRSLSPWTWRSHSIERRPSEQNLDDSVELPQIPHGTLTGIRTFIDGQGRTWADDSHMTQDNTMGQGWGRLAIINTNSNSRMIGAAWQICLGRDGILWTVAFQEQVILAISSSQTRLRNQSDRVISNYYGAGDCVGWDVGGWITSWSLTYYGLHNHGQYPFRNT